MEQFALKHIFIDIYFPFQHIPQSPASGHIFEKVIDPFHFSTISAITFPTQNEQ